MPTPLIAALSLKNNFIANGKITVRKVKVCYYFQYCYIAML